MISVAEPRTRIRSAEIRARNWPGEDLRAQKTGPKLLLASDIPIRKEKMVPFTIRDQS